VVNELLAALPAEPYPFLAARLRAVAAGAPVAEPAAAAAEEEADELLPEISTYLKTHNVVYPIYEPT
jgi:hypothetical protein